jgi:hypothetical protein
VEVVARAVKNLAGVGAGLLPEEEAGLPLQVVEKRLILVEGFQGSAANELSSGASAQPATAAIDMIACRRFISHELPRLIIQSSPFLPANLQASENPPTALRLPARDCS